VFDASVQADTSMKVDSSSAFRLRLGSDEAEFNVVVLYDDMDPEAKQKLLPLKITGCGAPPESAAVVSVNEKAVPPIPLALTAVGELDDCYEIRASMSLKELASHFNKGINRFVLDAGELSTEIVLEIEL